MGLRDAEEMLEAAKADNVRMERQLAAIAAAVKAAQPDRMWDGTNGLASTVREILDGIRPGSTLTADQAATALHAVRRVHAASIAFHPDLVDLVRALEAAS